MPANITIITISSSILTQRHCSSCFNSRIDFWLFNSHAARVFGSLSLQLPHTEPLVSSKQLHSIPCLVPFSSKEYSWLQGTLCSIRLQVEHANRDQTPVRRKRIEAPACPKAWLEFRPPLHDRVCKPACYPRKWLE